MSKSMDPDVIALEQGEEWPYHVVEYILLSPCPDAECGRSHVYVYKDGHTYLYSCTTLLI